MKINSENNKNSSKVTSNSKLNSHGSLKTRRV
jgi:hypothetical protein